jgi:Ankyrin repeat
MLIKELPENIRSKLLKYHKSSYNLSEESVMEMDTLDIKDSTMSCFSAQDILDIGEEHIPKNVWSQKIGKDLIESCKIGSIIGVRHHVKNGAKLNANDRDVLLLYAVMKHHLDIFEFLIKDGANVNIAGNLVLDVIDNNHLFQFLKCLYTCATTKTKSLCDSETTSEYSLVG